MKNKLKKFTFKTKKPSGRYRSFESEYHYIKLDKIVVGSINDEKPHTIRLMVIKKDINEDGNPNCCWKRITLKKESQSLEEAKKFLNENKMLEKIHSNYTFPKE